MPRPSASGCTATRASSPLTTAKASTDPSPSFTTSESCSRSTTGLDSSSRTSSSDQSGAPVSATSRATPTARIASASSRVAGRAECSLGNTGLSISDRRAYGRPLMRSLPLLPVLALLAFAGPAQASCKPAHSKTVLQNSQARVFTVKRKARGEAGNKVTYRAWYGCAKKKGKPHRLADSPPSARAADTYHRLILRGTVLGYVYGRGCPFTSGGACPGSFPYVVEARELRTGKAIRSI